MSLSARVSRTTDTAGSRYSPGIRQVRIGRGHDLMMPVPFGFVPSPRIRAEVSPITRTETKTAIMVSMQRTNAVTDVLVRTDAVAVHPRVHP